MMFSGYYTLFRKSQRNLRLAKKKRQANGIYLENTGKGL